MWKGHFRKSLWPRSAALNQVREGLSLKARFFCVNGVSTKHHMNGRKFRGSKSRINPRGENETPDFHLCSAFSCL